MASMSDSGSTLSSGAVSDPSDTGKNNSWSEQSGGGVSSLFGMSFASPMAHDLKFWVEAFFLRGIASNYASRCPR